MSDDDLRRLERRWKETGALADEAAFLLERVRSGDLDHDRLRLAAYCGHEAACVALGDSTPSRPADLGDWVSDIGHWGSAPSVRTALALAHLGLPLWEREDTLSALHAILEVAVAWLADPNEATHERACTVASEQGDLPFTPGMGAEGAGPVAAALAVVATVQEIRDSPSTGSAIYTDSPAEKLAQLVGEEAVRTAVLEAVGGWALGAPPPPET